MSNFPNLHKLDNWPTPDTVREAATALNTAGEK